jgi:hypothetical protein
VTKAALNNFAAEIARKRRELAQLQRDLASLADHLAVIEARAKSANSKRYSTEKVKRVLGLRAAGILQMAPRTGK